jgi:hypothetical protein
VGVITEHGNGREVLGLGSLESERIRRSMIFREVSKRTTVTQRARLRSRNRAPCGCLFTLLATPSY